MAPEALGSHLGWGCGVGAISQLKWELSGVFWDLPHLAHMNDCGSWADFFLPASYLWQISRLKLLFPGHGMSFAMSKVSMSTLFPDKKLCHLAFAVGKSSVGRNLIPCKFCLGKSLPSCLFLWLMKCISQGRNHMPCGKGNSSLQCNLHICLWWILILLY